MIRSAFERTLAGALICLLAGAIIIVTYQQSDAQDGTDDLNRLHERYDTPEAPRAQLDPTIPESPDPITAERIRFALTGINVDGSTIYSDAELLPLYRDFLGSEVTLSQVFQIAGRITVKYRADGYILSIAVVPAQKIKAGVVTIEVIEGFVSGV